jgi:hypothetical protein
MVCFEEDVVHDTKEKWTREEKQTRENGRKASVTLRLDAHQRRESHNSSEQARRSHLCRDHNDLANEC